MNPLLQFPIICEFLVSQQFRMHYLYKIAQNQVGVHYPGLIEVVASFWSRAEGIGVNISVDNGARVGKFGVEAFQFVKRRDIADINSSPSVCRQPIGLLHVNRNGAIRVVLLEDIFSRSIGNKSGHIALHRGHEP